MTSARKSFAASRSISPWGMSMSSGREMLAASHFAPSVMARFRPFPSTSQDRRLLSIRALALAFGRRFDKAPVLRGEEAPTAWIVDTSLAEGLFGYRAFQSTG